MLDSTEPNLSPLRKPGISLPLANGAREKKTKAVGVDVNQLTHLYKRLEESYKEKQYRGSRNKCRLSQLPREVSGQQGR